MNYKELFKRAMLLISSPAKAWEEINLEDRRKVFTAFVYPMIGLCGLSSFLGTIFDTGLTAIGFQRAMTQCCVVFVGLFGGYFLSSYAVNKLAVTMFRQEDNIQLMQQFVGYAMVVTFVLDIIVGVIPSFFILRWIFQFYTVFVVWEGTLKPMQVEEKNRMNYTIMASLLIIFTPAVLGFLFNKLTVILN